MLLDQVRKLLRLVAKKVDDQGEREIAQKFSATQNCDVKVSSARASDINMLPPEHR